MEKYKTWDDLTKDQVSAINEFMENPPKYYIWFYKFYKKFIGVTIFFSIIAVGILSIIHNNSNLDLWNLMKSIFFLGLGLVLWSLSAFLYKHFYTRIYAKKIGLTMKDWNNVTKGMSWDI